MSIKISKDIKRTQEEIAFANNLAKVDVTYPASFNMFLAQMVSGASLIAKEYSKESDIVIYHPVRVRLK